MTCWPYATWVKLAKIVKSIILTHMAYGQLVINMVNNGVYPKLKVKKTSSLVQKRAYLVYLLMFYKKIKILHVLGSKATKLLELHFLCSKEY